MNIFSVCGVAIVTAVLALLVRRHSPQSALLISIGSGVITFLAIVKNIVLTSDELRAILSSGNIRSDYIMILLKALGICFLTEFTCDTVTEAGLLSLSTNISFAGKVLVLVTALPLFKEVLSMVSAMVGAS